MSSSSFLRHCPHSSCRQVGQFDLARYAEYFELSTVEEAQADVERRHKKSENKARAGVDGESHEKSWFGGQMWRAKGERTRTKGRQLREHVELEHVERVFELQQRSCWATGQSIFLGKGGRKTPWTAAVELAPARTFHLVSSCLARGRASCPVEVFKDFLEYWGVSGHQYFQHLRIVGNGEVEDLQAGDVSEILGQDTSGERLAEARGSEGGDPGSGEEGRSGSESDGEGREEVASPAQHHLPFGGIDWTWGALRGPLSSSTGSGGGKYRRRGLSLNQASPALAGVELEADAMLDMTWRYRSPVLTRLEEHEGGE